MSCGAYAMPPCHVIARKNQIVGYGRKNSRGEGASCAGWYSSGLGQTMDRQDMNHLTLCCIVLLLKISLMYLCQVWLYDKILKIGKGMTYIYGYETHGLACMKLAIVNFHS